MKIITVTSCIGVAQTDLRRIADAMLPADVLLNAFPSDLWQRARCRALSSSCTCTTMKTFHTLCSLSWTCPPSSALGSTHERRDWAPIDLLAAVGRLEPPRWPGAGHGGHRRAACLTPFFALEEKDLVFEQLHWHIDPDASYDSSTSSTNGIQRPMVCGI